MPPRRRLAPLTLLLLLLGFGCPRPGPAPVPSPKSRGPLDGVLVVLDPGHGGEDSGAIRGGFREDALNYRLAAATASELRSRGATVWMTVSSRALPADLKPGKPEPPLIVPSDARLTFNGERVRLRAKGERQRPVATGRRLSKGDQGAGQEDLLPLASRGLAGVARVVGGRASTATRATRARVASPARFSPGSRSRGSRSRKTP